MTARRRMLAAALLGWALAAPSAAAAAKGARGFAFGVIGHTPAAPDDALLQRALRASEQAGLAFVVAAGIKAETEPCSDRLYGRRKALLDDSARPLIVALAASDWSECKNSLGRSAAIERLNRLRELFFDDEFSLGARKLTLARQSANQKFRSYAENAHWEYGRILFATVNLPANNNHFRPEAGRNSEFEDRLVANRAWLLRLFALARRNKLDGIVLFSDGDVGIDKEAGGAVRGAPRQDGFAAPRHQITALAREFAGQVLLVDAQGGTKAPAIAWRDNLGHLSVNGAWTAVRVNGARARRTPLFALDAEAGAP